MPVDREALNRIAMTVDIVSAYVERNSVPVADLAALIASVHDALALPSGPGEPAPVPAAPRPVVPIRRSVAADHIVCLEDGRRFKSLKRHLQAEHGLSPDAYRARWGLPRDYPMVAPAYADARSALAKTNGLGRRMSRAADGEAPVGEPPGSRQPSPGDEGSSEAA